MDTKSWPIQSLSEITPDDLENTTQKTAPFYEASAVSAVNPQRALLHPPLDITKFSSLNRLLRTIVFCFRYLKSKVWCHLSQITQDRFPFFQMIFKPILPSGTLSAIEVQSAQYYWEFVIQHLSFSEVFNCISLGSKHTLINQLGLYVDSAGLLRCRGRISNAQISYDIKYPILLPTDSPFTKLVIENAHQTLLHSGVQSTLAQIRQRYWVPKGRVAVRRYLSKCITCRKCIGGPFQLPQMPPFPAHRIQKARPFQYTGIDYFGPVWVKYASEKIKIWVCLFTCLVIRAIHLEPITDMTSQSFLLSLRRFIGRRGSPSCIYSDNAGQFKHTNKTLNLAWNSIKTDEDTLNYCSSHQITWKFITERAPWCGGFYERLVGIIKSSLRKSIGRNFLRYEQFTTLLVEVEAVINTRPLTYLYNDVDSNTILRPIDFLIFQGDLGTLDFDEESDDPEYIPSLDSGVKLLEFWKQTQRHLDSFWNIWLSEYLTSLRERFQLFHHSPRVTSDFDPTINTIVLIEEEGISRGSWKLGRITQLFKSNDGLIRSAQIQLPNQKLIKRSLKLLYPLEMNANKDSLSQNLPDQQNAGNDKTVANNTKPDQQSTPTHCYNLRPRLHRQVSTLLTLILWFSLVSNVTCSMCPNTTSLTFVDSQSCVNEGIVVFHQKDGNLCWIKKSCSESHLSQDGKCGKKCACPYWASECSYNNDPAVKLPDNWADTLLDERPNVCSFEPSDRCNSEPSTEIFSQLQLMDGSKHLVRQLNIKLVEPSTSQFDCIGTGEQTGTPEFCKHNKCEKQGKKLCFYKRNEIAYFVSEDEVEIPVKAWGSTSITFYGNKLRPPENPSCQRCNLKCVQGGIEIHLDGEVGLISVCSMPFCYQLSRPHTKETIQFPAETSLNSYAVQVKVWSNGLLIKHMGINCDGHPYCETITCYFCFIRIFNPQCTPISVFLILAVMLYFSSVTLFLLVKLSKYFCQLTYYAIYSIIKCMKFIYQFFHKTKITTTETLVMLLYFYLITNSEACSYATTLTAQTKRCERIKGGYSNCIFDETTRLSLVPQGQTSCLLINNNDGEPMGTLKLLIHEIGLVCQATNLFFTRSFHMKATSSKRCPGAGSCDGKKCEKYNKDSKIDELGEPANSSPGFTSCTSSCGCAACVYFWCTSGCLFHRIYAVPSTPTVYEAFNCPTWSFIVNATFILDLQGARAPSKHSVRLTPGVEKQWRNFKLALISLTAPTMPLLGHNFVTDGIRTIMVSTSPSGQPVSGQVGSMQCSDFDKAKAFDCYLPNNICICNPGQSSVNCRCSDMDLEPLFLKTENLIPLKTQGVSISGQGKKLIAELQNIASLEIQITMTDLNLVMLSSKTKCTISTLQFTGCYSCYTGAKLEFECKTDVGESLAHVNCGEGSFSTQCNASGTKDSTTMAFTTSIINEKCSVSCTAGVTYFQLEGTLVFVEKERLANISNILARSSGEERNTDIDIGSFLSWLSNHWITTIVIVIVVILLVFISIPLTPIISNNIAFQITKTQKYIKTKFTKGSSPSKPKQHQQHRFAFRKAYKKHM